MTGNDAPPGGLGRRFLVGTAQLGIGNWFSMLLNMAIGIAITRLLGPEDFGLYAFVFAINELLNILGALSLHSALIQSREESQELYDTALAICFGLGVAGIAISACIAPILWEHRGPDAAWFLMALSVTRVLRLSAQVPRARLERSMRYGTITTIQVVGGSLPNLVAMVLAFLGIGPWCLVIRDIGVGALSFAMEAGTSGYRFRGRVTRQAAADLMDFAKKLFLARTIDILVERVDRVTTGVFLGNAATGLLDRSRFLADFGLLAMRPIERTGMNLYSRLQDDRVRLSRAYTLVNYFLVRLVFTLTAVCFLVPGDFVRLVFGEEFAAAAGPLRWLALHAAFMPILTMVKVLVVACARVERLIRVSALQAAVLIPGTLLAGFLGSVEGAAMAVAATTTVGMLFAVRATRDLVDRADVRTMAMPLVVLALSSAVVFGAGALGYGDAVPWWIRPFAVGLTFVVGLVALEWKNLRAEFGYLRAQMAGPAENATGGGST